MGILDGWLNGRPRDHAKDAKIAYALSLLLSLLFFAYAVAAASGGWALTWDSVLLPLLSLAGSLQAYAHALDSRRAYQMARLGATPPSV